MELSDIQHDDDRWGVAFSAEESPRELVRFGELVKLFVDRETPVPLAAERVLSTLEASSVSCWFLMRPGCRAEVLDDRDIWREPPLFVEGRESGLPDWRLDWIRIGHSSGWAHFDDLVSGEWEEQGTRGLMSCLLRSFLEARTVADLDQVDVLANQVALLKEEAAAVLARCAPAALELVVEAVTNPARKRKPGEKVGQKIEGLPSDAQLLDELRGDGPEVRHGWIAKLARKYAVSRDTIERARDRALAAEAAQRSPIAAMSRALAPA